MLRDIYNRFRSDITNFKLSTLLFFLLLLCTDIVFLAIHLLSKFDVIADNRYLLISTDGGFAEVSQYIKELWIILLTAYITFKNKRLSYLIFVLLFAYLLMDDLFRIHENVGEGIMETFLGHNAGKLEAALIQFAFSLIIFLTFWCLLYFSNKLKSENGIGYFSKKLILLVIFLGVFGVGVDFLNTLYNLSIGYSIYISGLLNVIKEFGEMIIISMITAFVFFHASKNYAVEELPTVVTD